MRSGYLGQTLAIEEAPCPFFSFLVFLKKTLKKQLGYEVAPCQLFFRNVALSSLASTTSDIPAGLSAVNLSMNKCFDTESVKALADAIPKSKIQTLVIGPKATTVLVQQADVTALDFSAQDLGPAELMMISSVMQFNPAGLNDITIDSTGNLEDQKKYTISSLQGGGARG